jgi:hypothetical protein
MVKKAVKNDRLKVFLPNARLLTEEEIAGLPAEKRGAVKVAGGDGLWIEVDCPEGSCSIDGSKITIPAGGVTPGESKGIWLNLFCPEDQCELEQSTDLP